MTKNNWIKQYDGCVPIFEACFEGNAYAPHSHDDYTVALTTRGVQSFNYRGEKRHSQVGQAVILHPGELHDGMAGTDSEFAYRAISIDPEVIQDAIGGKPLPFIKEGVINSGPILNIANQLLRNVEDGLSLLEYEGLTYELAIALDNQSVQPQKKHKPNTAGLKVVKNYLESYFLEDLSLEKLVAVSGYTKWHLIRDFKTLFGSTPYQYVLFLRLNHAKKQLVEGNNIADAALASCFSDQSHLTRKFKQRFGLTPKQWTKLIKQ